jgi:hypothetical protein
VRVTGLLCWYDESPIWLAAAATAAARLCDHVVAVDGAYALYPGGKPQSDPEQAEAILHAAYAAGIGVTVHRPREVWMGNQIEKRTALFRLGAETGADWFYVFDADDLVTHVPADARDRLEQADEDVAVFTLWWTEDVERDEAKAAGARMFSYPHEAANRYFRGLFRALPGLRVEGAHYHYVADRDGGLVHLRGHEDVHELEPFLNLTDMRVQHRHPQRARARLEVSAAYDRLVRAHGLEKTTAEAWAAA